MALEWISCTINEGETACLESSLLDPSFENQTEDRLFVDFVISPALTRTHSQTTFDIVVLLK